MLKQSIIKRNLTVKPSFLLRLTALTCLSGALYAQSDEIIKPLSPDSQTILARLDQLNHLPEGKWKFHPGDVPHGESIGLNDSDWELVGKNSKAPTQAVWYRQWIVIPKQLYGYDLTGARISFQFSASTSGPIEKIIYANGRRIASGDHLESIALLDQVKPGDKLLVAVKLPFTMDAKDFDGSEIKIDFPSNRPNPEQLRQQLLSAAALNPTLSTNSEADQAALEKAIQAIDIHALSAGDQVKFDSSLKQSLNLLQQFKPAIRQTGIHLTGNSHIDAAWMWPWTETVDVVKRTFLSAAQLMNEYPDYTYTQSAVQYNEWIAEKYPAINNEIKRHISEGRWEIVGGMWVEPDLNMPDGESLARSLLIGKRWIRKEYSVDVRIGWNPDSFGYNWQLPQIYKKSGIDYFVTQKMSWSDTNKLPFKLFWWQSPDGSKVLTYFPHNYDNTNLSPVRLSADLAVARKQAPGMTEMMDLYGVGDHGGGPTRAVLDEGVSWIRSNRVAPKMAFGSAQPFFSAIEKQLDKKSPVWNYQSIAKGYQEPAANPGSVTIPTWNSEMYLEYHRGVTTTQANHKRNMRESTEWALNAEKYASLAWLDGDKYPQQQLTEAWKKITFNDFHDLAAGSGIGVIYKDAQRDYDQVHWSTNEISRRALDTIAARVNTRTVISREAVPVMIFNPLAWNRTGIVALDVQMPTKVSTVSIIDQKGKVLPSIILSENSQANIYHLLVNANDVPSLGYKIVYAIPEKRDAESDLQVHDTTLENSALRVTVDKSTGCIVSLYDKKTNFESIAKGGCGNELQVFSDTPKQHDAWNIDPGTLDKTMANLMKADSVEIIEQSPLRAVIRVTRNWSKSKFVQDIALYTGGNQVEVSNDITWNEMHVLLKAAVPLAASSPMATFEIPYGSIERPTTRNNSWEQAQFEVPALRWADLGDGKHGLSLINESKYGYDARDNVLRLSLLRSPTYPDPMADRGQHHFSYALYPHGGDWKEAQTVRHGYEFNYKLQAMQVGTHDGTLPAEYSFVSTTPENVVLTAMKKAEDTNSLIFHLYEFAGKTSNVEITIPTGATAAIPTNLLEYPIAPAVAIKNNKVTVPIHAYEIYALRVDYPFTKS
jgi:alpha-mannosidase